MRKTHSRGKLNIPFVLAIIMIWFTAVTVFLIGGLYARYTTEGSAFDSARVIKFNRLEVKEEGAFATLESGNNQFLVIPGVNITKDFLVDFGGSESATIVFVVAETPGWTQVAGSKYDFTAFSGKMTWKADQNQWTALTPTTSVANVYVYYSVLGPNETLKKSFIENARITVAANITRNELATLESSPMQIRLTAYAVQSNGFDSVEAAWESLSQKHRG